MQILSVRGQRVPDESLNELPQMAHIFRRYGAPRAILSDHA